MENREIKEIPSRFAAILVQLNESKYFNNVRISRQEFMSTGICSEKKIEPMNVEISHLDVRILILKLNIYFNYHLVIIIVLDISVQSFLT